MYFKEKENTNIDQEFQQKKTIDIQKYKPLILIVGGLIVLFIIIFIIAALSKPKPTTPTGSSSIELLGAKVVTITLGNDYIEAGYTAVDSNNNDITSEVVVNSNLQINEVGTYQITYQVNGIEEQRIIKVVEPTNETYIYLKGEKNIYLKVGAKYVEPGFVAHDTNDGSLTDSVVVTGTVNTKIKGLYKIVYTVVNSNEITTQVERNVIVE